MKPPYSGNGIPERVFMRRPSQCQVQVFCGQDNRIAWGQCCRLQIETLCGLAQWEPQTSVSTCCQCAKEAAIRSHEGPSSSFRVPSWIAASELEKYSLENNTPFKILLIVDNAPVLPRVTGDQDPSIKVVFLPSNPTFLVPPMDQGVIEASATCYLRGGPLSRLLLQLRKTLMQYWRVWKGYSIMTAAGILLGLGVMLPRRVWMVSGKKYSRSLPMTSEALPKVSKLHKSRLRLRWQTTLTSVWTRMSLRSS